MSQCSDAKEEVDREVACFRQASGYTEYELGVQNSIEQ
jgi:hypothetical protein